MTGARGGPALRRRPLHSGRWRANRIAMWSGSAWSPLGSGISGGNPSVNSLGVYDDGSGDGPALIVGGGFNFAGDVFRPRIAKWNGMAWSGVGPGMSDGTVTSLVVFDDGSGTKLYAGGSFTGARGRAGQSSGQVEWLDLGCPRRGRRRRGLRDGRVQRRAGRDGALCWRGLQVRRRDRCGGSGSLGVGELVMPGLGTKRPDPGDRRLRRRARWRTGGSSWGATSRVSAASRSTGSPAGTGAPGRPSGAAWTRRYEA